MPINFNNPAQLHPAQRGGMGGWMPGTMDAMMGNFGAAGFGPPTPANPPMVAPSPTEPVKQPGMSNRDALTSPEFLSTLAVGLGGMSHRPNRSMQALGMETIKRARDMRQIGAMGNQTADWLESQGNTQMAELVRQNPAMAQQAMRAHMEQQNAERFTPGTLADGTQIDVNTNTGRRHAVGGAGTNVTVENNTGPSLSPFEEKLDELQAAEIIDWRNAGQVKTANNINALRRAQNMLMSGESEPGKFQGLVKTLFGDDLYSSLLPAEATTEQLVASVTQQSLKEILGGQFAQKEGEQLIKRAFDPNLSPEENSRRIGQATQQLELLAQARDEMALYATTNRTLQGYEGQNTQVLIDQFKKNAEALQKEWDESPYTPPRAPDGSTWNTSNPPAEWDNSRIDWNSLTEGERRLMLQQFGTPK